MPTLNFKGKTFVQNHHLAVKYHQLVPDKAKSLTDKVSLHDNLIIHGDNLLALKALLPTYAGKVKCIYIDPPYNTGNEGWKYNDNVRSPMLQQWLGKTVDKDDLTRHDKWLCMMMPRLKLLWELLSEDGVIFISIDDNEISNLRLLMNEIFGDDGFVQEIIWKNKYGPGAMTKSFGNVHEYILCFTKNPLVSVEAPLTLEEVKTYRLRDSKFATRGGYVTQPLMTRSKDDRENLVYPIKYRGETINPEKQWIWERERLLKAIENDEVVFNKSDEDKWSVRFKQYLKDDNGNIRKGKPISIMNGPFNQDGTWEIEELFGDKNFFNNPKPSALIRRLLSFIINGDESKEFFVLDSFAGSGTTAHAVIDMNREDGGNRKFILIEQEDYADSITAERVRGVIARQNSEDGSKKSEDKKQGSLIAEQEKDAKKPSATPTFSFFRLGDPIEMESILTGDSLPPYNDLARYVFYTATGEEFDESVTDEARAFIGESAKYRVYMLYKPDIEYLKRTALTLDWCRALPAWKSGDKRRLVFAPAKYVDDETANLYGVDFCQLPYEIYRLQK